jgi:autotransporter translocation and assembly factor TamB
MDFSNVTINDASIRNAKNDCYDVSTGTYNIITGQFEMCGDKGMSVGEGSNLHAESLKVLGSNIGISSKDYSKVTINSATFANVITCVEAKQKKQEFGGASAVLNKMDCNGGFEIDKHSIVKVGGNEL